MPDDNPYQSPQHYGPAEDSAPVAGAGEGVWRQGNLLVVRKGAALPDRCVLSNKPASGFRAKQTYYWLPPRLYLRALFGLLFGAILLLPKYRREVVVEMPLSPKRHARRRRWQWIGWALALLGFGVNQFMIHAVARPVLRAGGGMAVAVGGIVMLLAGLFVVLLSPGLRLRAKRIRGDYVWLKGVHPDYLAGLPEWPGP